MNYAESFEQFSSRLGPMDLVLYAGAGIIIYVLFQDKLKPIKDYFLSSLNKTTSNLPITNIITKNSSNDDLFFDLVTSWKKTRDLAVKNNCDEAVKVADQMFPYLSPNGCSKNGEVV